MKELLLLATVPANLVVTAAVVYALAMALVVGLALPPRDWFTSRRDAVQMVEADRLLAPLDEPDPLDEHFRTLPSGVAGPGREVWPPPMTVHGPPSARGVIPVQGGVIRLHSCSWCRDVGASGPDGCPWCGCVDHLAAPSGGVR